MTTDSKQGAQALLQSPASPAGWRKLPRWPAFWQDSAYNPWGWVMEQRSLDGRHRHMGYDDNLRPTGWVDGPHPVAQKLREEGKEKTDCFDRLRKFG